MKLATALRSLISPKRAPTENLEQEYPLPRQAGPAASGTQITVSLPASLSGWLRSYALSARKSVNDIAGAAIARAKTSTAPAQYTEPGTSVTRMGVAEVELTLGSDDAKWLLGRAAQDHVSHCAVFHAALSHYSEVAPAIAANERRVYVTGQEFYYNQITGICEDAGRLSADEADLRLADAVAVRLYRLLPEVERDTVLAAAHAAIRELCLNYPPLRRAHGRDQAPTTELGKRHPSGQGDAPRDARTQ